MRFNKLGPFADAYIKAIPALSKLIRCNFCMQPKFAYYRILVCMEYQTINTNFRSEPDDSTMSDASPTLSAWEDIGDSHPSSFDLDIDLVTTDYDSDASWDMVPTSRRAQAPNPAVVEIVTGPKPQRCDHWAARGCSLAGGLCCACSDERPHTVSGLYGKYADGQGWVEGTNRWAYYCPGCHGYQRARILNKVGEKLRAAARRRAAAKALLPKPPVPKCKHWHGRHCSLTTDTGRCCACSDRRHASGNRLYPVYVDGRGWVNEAAVWEHYCPGCKAYYEARDIPSRSYFDRKIQDERERVAEKRLDDEWARKRCPHFVRWGCGLTASSAKCCACTDRRSYNKSGCYEQYVDGKGFVNQAARSEYYCFGCREGWKRQEQRKERRRARRRRREDAKARAEAEAAEKAKVTNERCVDHEHSQVTSQPLVGDCSHWAERACALTNPRLCCACADQRPEAPSYTVYVDGSGWRMGASRWCFYCPGCLGS